MQEKTAAQAEPGGGTFRAFIEFFVCLAIAVVLFKGFLIEGYVITTGSMAPTLLGYHKQVECPSCKYGFALGVSNGVAPTLAVCPNCDETGIQTNNLAVNDGDQVLVNKSSFLFRRPKRWEVAVFRNPSDTSQAYVKRMIGLPGERVQVFRGDILINGEVARKPLEAQRGIRILVHDHAHQPTDGSSDWSPRWLGEQPWWQPRTKGFAVDTRAEPGRLPRWAWLTYRHWNRVGGRSITKVEIPPWPAGTALPSETFEPVWYDPAAKSLCCRGTMPESIRDRLQELAATPKIQTAIDQLYAESHIAPITDFYAYNRQVPGNGGNLVVRDLMLSTRVDYKAGLGEFRVEMSDGAETFSWVLDTQNNQTRLEVLGEKSPIRSAPLPSRFLRENVLLEMSIFDRQVLCAMDGELPFLAWEIPQSAPMNKSAPRRQVRLGAHGIRLHVLELQVFRDVYYTADGGADKQTWDLKDLPDRQEYFVLGDNSPISVDSRLWDRKAVLTPQLIMGKPFIVHLPARTSRVNIGPWHADLRVPDWSRFRYIR